MSKPFFKDAFSVLWTRAVTFALSLWTGIVVARLLGVKGKGALAALLVVPHILLTFCDLGIRQFITHSLGRGLAQAKQIYTVISVLFLVSLTFGAIMIVAVFRYGLKVQFSDLLILLAVAFFGMHVVLAYSRGILLGSGQLARFNKGQWFVPLARCALVLLFLGILGWAVEGAVLAETLSLALVLPLLFLGSALPVKFGYLDLSLMGRMLKLGIKFAAALLMINLLYRVDVLMLTELSTLDQVGAYSLASNIGELLWQLSGAISVAVLMYAARDSGGADFLSRVP